MTKKEERQKRQQEKLAAELGRLENMKVFERKYEACGLICGIDEAGRGPLAGPVVAGAVILPRDSQILWLNDSKKLTAGRRELLYDEIMEKALAVGIGVVSHERVDEINILQATYEAMRQAIEQLGMVPDVLLNDAVTIPGVELKQVPIIKGDAKSVSIAAASVIAKVTRDRMMIQMDQKYPGYGFASNKGYGSAAHIAAIREKGPCEIHRRTFIRNFTGQQSGKNGEAANEQTTDRNSI
ncbi:MAG: ribonuclease HII [Lachnospiraceae bacterium]|nr:ribonuclease HII [Lachnospiraceae bacterium]